MVGCLEAVSTCDVRMFFSKLPCNSGALQVMLRVVWGEAFQAESFQPGEFPFPLSPWHRTELLLFVPTCILLASSLLPPLPQTKVFSPCAFVLYESYWSTSLPGAEFFRGWGLLERGLYARKSEDELHYNAVETRLHEVACFEELLVAGSWPTLIPCWELLQSLVHPAEQHHHG